MSAPVAAKKTATPKASKKAAAPASHPSYKSMIKKAVGDLKEKGGSSRAAIVKYIAGHYKVGDKNAVLVKQNLKRMIAKKELVHASSKSHGANGSFKLPSKEPQAKKPKSPKKTTSPAKKAATPKSKASPKKAKSVAKPKAAKKSPAKKTVKKPAVKKAAKKAPAKK